MLFQIVKPPPMSQAMYILILYLAFSAVLVGAVLIIGFNIKAKRHKNKISKRLKYDTISMNFIICATIFAALNFGWNRYCFAFYMMGQSILLIVGTDVASRYADKSGLVKNLVIVNYILYGFTNIIMPDYLTNNWYGFFGFVSYGEFWGNIVLAIVQIIFIVNVLFLIAEIVASLWLKKHGT